MERKKEDKCTASGVEIAVTEYIRSVNDGDADDSDVLELPALTSYMRAVVHGTVKAPGGVHFKAQSAGRAGALKTMAVSWNGAF